MVEQGLGEPQTYELVGFRMGDPHSLGSQVAARLGQICSRGQGDAGNLQQNLRGERQRASYGQQGAGGGNVQRRGEFQHVFPILIMAADKNRNRQGQA